MRRCIRIIMLVACCVVGGALLFLASVFFVDTRPDEQAARYMLQSERVYLTAPVPLPEKPVYLKPADLLQYQDCECRYIKYYRVPSSLDGNGDVWSGMLHSFGIFPVLGRSGSGFVKTVVVDRNGPQIRYQVVYIKEDQLTDDYRVTFWYLSTGKYDVSPEAPMLCPNPWDVLLARL